MQHTPRDKDAVVYRWVAFALRLGAFAGFGTMLVGLLWWFAAGTPGGDASSLKSLPLTLLLPRLLALDPLALLNVGILLLLLTPAAALLSQVGAYGILRDRRFAAIAAFVVLLLLLGLAISILRS